jgi:putative Mg2+ transporter-C (MgtC) family protein
MTGLSTSLSWSEIALRVALTVAVSVLIGYNRSEHGKAAGMCTTLLVCLAASVAMIDVNLLLPTAGRSADSFVMNDLMRLPLGILTGVGFIGAGAILRRDNIVVGVTTAATLWLVTVIGLCLGGGQIVIGLIATVLGIFALWVLKSFENRLRQEHNARLVVTVDVNGPSESDLRHRLKAAGLSISGTHAILQSADRLQEFSFHVVRVCRREDTGTPQAIAALAWEPGIVKLEWGEFR